MNNSDVITRFGDNLLLFRQSIGWSAAELGDRVGVTRQTINNIENKKVPLSKTLYLAIRCVFAEEMNSKPAETKMLRFLLEYIVDHPEELKEEDRNKIIEKTKMITPSIMSQTTIHGKNSTEWMEKVSKEWMEMIKNNLLSIIGAVSITIGFATIFDALEKKQNKDMFSWVSAITEVGSHKKSKIK